MGYSELGTNDIARHVAVHAARFRTEVRERERRSARLLISRYRPDERFVHGNWDEEHLRS